LTVEVLCEEISFLQFESEHFGEALETFSYEIPVEHISDNEGASWTPLCGVSSVSSSNLPSFCEFSALASPEQTTTTLSCLAKVMEDVGVHTFTILQNSQETSVTLTIDQGNLTELTEFEIPENSKPKWTLDDPLIALNEKDPKSL
jgi:hypothetical protein